MLSAFRRVLKRWLPPTVRDVLKARLPSSVKKMIATQPNETIVSLYQWNFDRAKEAYKALNSDLALSHLQACIETNPDDWFMWHFRGIVYLQLVGNLNEAVRQFSEALKIRERLYIPESGVLPYRFLDSFWGYQIGHIANMEHLIKREILQGRDPKRLILLFPAGEKAGNRLLLKKMSDFITVVGDERKLPAPKFNMNSVMEEYYVCKSIDGRLKHWWHASPEIFNVWERTGRKPLLTLTPSETKQGRKLLHRLGLPDDAWFVSLHVRESGFKQDQGYSAVEAVLNADIETYTEAMESVADRGGWVIRIGDERMRPLPPMRNVIDYACSSHKSEAADVFLLGGCRFFIGTSSGPAYVPPLFGIPCVLTNWAPTGQRPFNERDLYILKVYDEPLQIADKVVSRPMKFSEFLSPPIGYAANCEHAQSLKVVANSPAEICEVVVEMLDRLDGHINSTTSDEKLQTKFDQIAEANECIGNARVGTDFLRRHVARLER